MNGRNHIGKDGNLLSPAGRGSLRSTRDYDSGPTATPALTPPRPPLT